MTTFQEYDDYMRKLSDSYSISDKQLVTFGMLEEAGEVAGKLKRKYREGDFDKQEIAKKLGDVLGYLTCIYNELVISLEDVVKMNVNKLSERERKNKLLGAGDNR